MKYQAINDKVIGKLYTRKQTAGGIFVAAPVEHPVIELEVCSTTELTKELQDKTVCIERRHVQELGEEEEVKYGAFKYSDILAVKHD